MEKEEGIERDSDGPRDAADQGFGIAEEIEGPRQETASSDDELTFTAEHDGTARIKPEFIDKDRILENWNKKVGVEKKKDVCGAESGKNEEPPTKKSKKEKRGQNKHRPRDQKINPSERLCPSVANETVCHYAERCRYEHNVESFMAKKPPDIGEKCHVFEKMGKCRYGLSCRFGNSHISMVYKNVVDEEKLKDVQPEITNVLSKDLQKLLWKKKYKFEKASKVLGTLMKMKKSGEADVKPSLAAEPGDQPMEVTTAGPELSTDAQSCIPKHNAGTVTDEDMIRLRACEKKKIDFSDKLYLAPLTTVGNLPYRRICKKFGVDITCGEMAMCTNLLQGQLSEWALLKRHSSEDVFGVQLCGSFPDTMTKCAELLSDSIDVDFIDINVGCPIDLVFKKGGGCALMGRLNKFEQIVTGMTSVMDVPLTVKMRTGIQDKSFTAHKVIPKLRDWGVSMVTIHGRSREQRYTKLADWDYINECAQAAAPMPLFGNGDILSYEDANRQRQHTGVTGVMLARGALIKPWVFTEIKEQRHWDISSTERLDILQDFVNYGLEHWGSDQQGVDRTRRFLLEWLSFLYRYIPVGVLERVPQKINERPPYYFGRNDLETLMASGNYQDWIKISEMMLGPVSSGFQFLPKHKANAYK